MDLFKHLPYDIQYEIYNIYNKEHSRRLKIYAKKKYIIRILACVRRVSNTCRYIEILNVMTSCHTVHNYNNLKYYRYWSVHDWILWEFIIYVKNNMSVGDRRIGESEHIYKYVYLWNYISNKYKK